MPNSSVKASVSTITDLYLLLKEIAIQTECLPTSILIDMKQLGDVAECLNGRYHQMKNPEMRKATHSILNYLYSVDCIRDGKTTCLEICLNPKKGSLAFVALKRQNGLIKLPLKPHRHYTSDWHGNHYINNKRLSVLEILPQTQFLFTDEENCKDFLQEKFESDPLDQLIYDEKDHQIAGIFKTTNETHIGQPLNVNNTLSLEQAPIVQTTDTVNALSMETALASLGEGKPLQNVKNLSNKKNAAQKYFKEAEKFLVEIDTKSIESIYLTEAKTSSESTLDSVNSFQKNQPQTITSHYDCAHFVADGHLLAKAEEQVNKPNLDPLNHNPQVGKRSSSNLSIGEISRENPTNALLARTLRSTGRAIAGHGVLPKDFKSFALPWNVQLNTYRIPGQSLSDRIGIHIEAGHIAYLEAPGSKYAKAIFKRTYRPGNLVPNYLIFPPDHKINPIQGSIMVSEPTFLSQIIHEKSRQAAKTGKKLSLDLACCQSYLLKKLEDQPKKNINDRIEILQREINFLSIEYGKNPPAKVVNHIVECIYELEKDISQYQYFLTPPNLLSRIFKDNDKYQKEIEKLRDALTKSIVFDDSLSEIDQADRF